MVNFRNISIFVIKSSASKWLRARKYGSRKLLPTTHPTYTLKMWNKFTCESPQNNNMLIYTWYICTCVVILCTCEHNLIPIRLSLFSFAMFWTVISNFLKWKRLCILFHWSSSSDADFYYFSFFIWFFFLVGRKMWGNIFSIFDNNRKEIVISELEFYFLFVFYLPFFHLILSFGKSM